MHNLTWQSSLASVLSLVYWYWCWSWIPSSRRKSSPSCNITQHTSVSNCMSQIKYNLTLFSTLFIYFNYNSFYQAYNNTFNYTATFLLLVHQTIVVGETTSVSTHNSHSSFQQWLCWTYTSVMSLRFLYSASCLSVMPSSVKSAISRQHFCTVSSIVSTFINITQHSVTKQ